MMAFVLSFVGYDRAILSAEFFMTFFPVLASLLILGFSAWISVQNYNKNTFRFLLVFLNLASLACFGIMTYVIFTSDVGQYLFKVAHNNSIYRDYDHRDFIQDLSIKILPYAYLVLGVLNVYLYILYNRVIAKPQKK